MKRKITDLNEQERIRTLDMLYTAVGAVQGRGAMKLFLRDLLTPSERIMLGRRIWIARLLLSGYSELEVQRKLGVGPNTVYKVARWLEDQMPGYEKAIKGLEKVMDKRAIKSEEMLNPFSFAALKKKYRLHFLLFPNPKPKKQYRD